MKILIAAIGKAKASPEQALYAEYIRRLPWQVSVKELEEKRALTPAQLKEREGELLLAATQGNDILIALDENGKSLTSEQFAALIGRWRDQGQSRLAFVIGGSDGLSQGLLAKAHTKLSLGALTWPHLLVRALLAEQLYRAHTILSGHPYHRA